MTLNAQNTELETARDSIRAAIQETREAHPENEQLAKAADRVERHEKARDVGNARHEPVRDSFKAAQEELKVKETADQGNGKSDPDAELVDDQDDKSEKGKNKGKPDPELVEASQDEKDDKEPDTDKGQQQKRGDKLAFARNGLPKQVQQELDALPQASREYMLRLQKETMDTKAEAGRRAYLNEVDKVLEPIMPKLKELGATPAQLVHRMLQYSDALASDQHKAGALAQFCRDFDLFPVVLELANQINQQQEQYDQMPPEQRELAAKIDQIIAFQQQQQQQTQYSQHQVQKQELDRNATTQYGNWAKETGAQHANDPVVMRKMAELIRNNPTLYAGKVSGINANLAYKHACEALEVDEPFKAKAQPNNQQKQQHKHAPQQQKPNGQRKLSGPQNSVRNSLRAAIAEARGAQR